MGDIWLKKQWYHDLFKKKTFIKHEKIIKTENQVALLYYTNIIICDFKSSTGQNNSLFCFAIVTKWMH